MSIPDDEIDDDEQNALRRLLRGTVLSDLHEPIRDRIVRELHHYHGDDWTAGFYRALLAPRPDGQRSRFPSLSEPQQTKVLDALFQYPRLEHAQSMRGAIDAAVAGGLTGTLLSAAVDVVAAPVVRTADLPDATRSGVASWFWLGYRYRAGAIGPLLRSPAFGRMGDEDKARVLLLLSACHADGVDHLLQLLEAPLARFDPRPSDRATPTLLTTDKDGTTLLATLERLAVTTAKPHADVGVSDSRLPLDVPPTPRVRGRGRARVDPPPARRVAYHGEDATAVAPAQILARTLADLLAEVAWPDQHINQDNRGTCTVTSLLHRLVWQQPAEYARMAVDLTLSARTTLRNGDSANVPDGALPADRSTRSVSERLTQATLMQYAHAQDRTRRGAPIRYFNTRPDDHDGAQDRFSDGSEGLIPASVQRVADAILIGGPFVPHFVDIPNKLIRHFERNPNVPVFVHVADHLFDVVGVRPPDANAQTIRWQINREPPPEPGVLYWNPWGAALLLPVDGHYVRVHDGTVAPPSATAGHDDNWRPDRRTIDETRAIQRMTWRSMTRLITAAHFPPGSV